MDCFILFDSGHRISVHLSKYLKTYLLNKIKKEIEKHQLNRWIDILIIKKTCWDNSFLYCIWKLNYQIFTFCRNICVCIFYITKLKILNLVFQSSCVKFSIQNMRLNEEVLNMWSTLFSLSGNISKGEKDVKDNQSDEPSESKGM